MRKAVSACFRRHLRSVRVFGPSRAAHSLPRLLLYHAARPAYHGFCALSGAIREDSMSRLTARDFAPELLEWYVQRFGAAHVSITDESDMAAAYVVVERKP